MPGALIRNIIILIHLLCISYPVSSTVESLDITQKLSEIKALTDKKQAIEQSKQLLKFHSLTAHQTLSILQTQADLYFSLKDLEQAITATESIKRLANENKLTRVEAKAHKMIGVYHYYQGGYPKALQSYQTALSYYEYFNEEIQQANLHNNIGLVHAAMGQTFQTLDSYKKAETIYVEKGSEIDVIDIRYNIAGLYLRLKRYDIAIEMFIDVIEKRKELQDDEGLASVYSDIAITYKYKGEYQVAQNYLLQALDYYLTANNPYQLASTYHNLADVFTERYQLEQAQKYAELALQLSEENGYNSILAGSLHSLAQVLFFKGETTKSLALIKRSTELAKKNNYQPQVRNNLLFTSQLYVALDDRVKAFEARKEYIALNNQLSNEQLNQYLAQFESTKLKQQVTQLEKNEALRQLDIDRLNQQRNFIIIAIVITLFVAFFIYRRVVDRKLNLHLETKVKQRTQELETLAKQLEQANLIKSQFLANMSHEIRTPLTAIIGQAEAIVSGDVEEDYFLKEVGIIHGNSLHLLDLINNILDLSKIEANKLELEIREQDLHTLLLELNDMFIEQARSKGLSFEISHSLTTPFIFEFDVLRVKQILINLCSNAIKFTRKGSVKVFVELSQDSLNFAVSDTGIGMSYTQIQSVFESFTQGDSSISRRFGGSGLGLCLSEQLAKMMSGRIEITSTLNKGSTFSFILPVSLQENAMSSSKVHVIKAGISSKQQVYSGKILLAEDHDDNRRLIARYLTKLGLEVVGACNGREAIEQYLKHRPRVILLDIQMPEMDGIEAFKILRQRGCSEPIIALTANAMSHEVEHYLELGFTGHLKKPIDREEFIRVLARYYRDDIDEEEAVESLDNVDMTDLVLQFKSNLVLEQQDIILQIKNEDYQKLAELVHRIAGAAQMFGYALLSEKAVKLEQAIKAGLIDKVPDLSQALLNEVDQILW